VLVRAVSFHSFFTLSSVFSADWSTHGGLQTAVPQAAKRFDPPFAKCYKSKLSIRSLAPQVSARVILTRPGACGES
jgi:hypothetical protein